MRTTNHTARGIPLAVLFFLLAWTSWAVMGEGTFSIDQTISPNRIYVAGTDEEPISATLTIAVASVGPAVRYPIDCLFVIDTSATSDLVQAKEFAFDLIDQFGFDDRVGVVSYGTTAELDIPLTHNLGAAKLAIADLRASGKSAMGLAMQMARRELDQVGRENAILVEVLISDGQSSVGIEPDTEGTAAAQIGIQIVAVGLGTLINRNMLEGFAEETGGQFFERPTDRARTEILNDLAVYAAARELRVEKRIPAELRLVDASPEASQIELHQDGSTTAIWRLADLELGEGTSIEMEFEVLEKGEWETDVSSTVQYVDFRGVKRIEEIPSLVLKGILPNSGPVALFSVEDGIANTVDSVVFEDESFDDDGDVVAWEWDFGDETTSLEQNPEHRFHDTGTFTVSLVAIDEDGEESEPYEAEVTVALGPRVTATRTIESCLPGDLTVPDATVDITLLIDVKGMLNGLAIVETIPAGWTFVEGDNDGATARQTGTIAEWLFVEKLVGEEINSQREIRYTLQAPADAVAGESGLAQASIQGSVASSSPRFEQTILGEDKLSVAKFLPIPIVISRWDTDTSELRLCEPDPEVIDFAEIQYAVSLWLSGNSVPQTDNRAIDIVLMQDLIAYWLTGRSVHDSLP
ncbi:MAG: VWA domain-containing protein [Candidatus Bipolaricaulia bacterium]